jgi:protein-S-isoprenylcysteine O-methyltransferase Ste14
MSSTSGNNDPSQPARRALLVSLAFYSLIAFEFFYMATPFAAYVYAVYGPGLDSLQGFGGTSWSIGFFLPHIVAETRSPLLNGAEAFGTLLFLGGVFSFAAGALQIYRAKLMKRAAVTGGVYRHIRHPQYLSLMVASLGMLLLWPRFLVLILTVTVIFLYIGLARAEEALCLRQYPGYADYMRRTGMFLPKGWIPWPRIRLPQSRWTRVAAWSFAYVATLSAMTFLAFGLRNYAIDQLYSWRSGNALYVSVTALPEPDIARVAQIALSNTDVQAALGAVSADALLLNYVVPTSVYISEIPMHLPDGTQFGHVAPQNLDPSLYKVIFTVAEFDSETVPLAQHLLRHVVNKRPLIEVHVNLATKRVATTFPPPKIAFYGGRQVPVF